MLVLNKDANIDFTACIYSSLSANGCYFYFIILKIIIIIKN